MGERIFTFTFTSSVSDGAGAEDFKCGQKPNSDQSDWEILEVQDVPQARALGYQGQERRRFPRHDKKADADAQAVKPLKFYPADDVKKPLVNKRKAKPTKLRASITPGTVLIILAGRFMGKRVVFLKQLSSGLLLVTGPFKINGVPLRRVNQSYVIGTKKIDISRVNADKFDDKYFAKEVQKKKKKGEGEFFEAEEDESVLPQEKKEDQKAVDTPLIRCVNRIADMKEYLAARFSLKQGMKPHELVF